MEQINNRKIIKGKRTLFKLKKTAKSLFSKKGYAKTSTEDIVSEAKVTRGALYHHFKGKKDLFRAVFDDVHVDIANEIIKQSRPEKSSWDRLLKGTYTFLNVCMEPEIQRIVLIDGPAVLGWQEWREIDTQRSVIFLKKILKDLMMEQQITGISLDATTHLISGATNELALWIAQAKKPEQALEEARLTLRTMFEKLFLSE